MRRTHLLTLAAAFVLVFTTLSWGAVVRDTYTRVYAISFMPIVYTIPARRVLDNFTHGGRRVPARQIVIEEANRAGVPVTLALAVVRTESNFACHVTSRAGAIGLMQIKYRTARGLGYSGSAKGLYDCRTNAHWGMKYLKKALVRARGNHCVAAHLYYSGIYAKRMTRESRAYCGRVMKRL